MESYKLLIAASAAKELEAVPARRDRIRLVARIQALAATPRPRACEKLGGAERYRVRQGTWRVLYEVSDADHAVTIVKIGNRRDVYR